jgi:hypothetical protein
MWWRPAILLGSRGAASVGARVGTKTDRSPVPTHLVFGKSDPSRQPRHVIETAFTGYMGADLNISVETS